MLVESRYFANYPLVQFSGEKPKRSSAGMVPHHVVGCLASPPFVIRAGREELRFPGFARMMLVGETSEVKPR